MAFQPGDKARRRRIEGDKKQPLTDMEGTVLGAVGDQITQFLSHSNYEAANDSMLEDTDSYVVFSPKQKAVDPSAYNRGVNRLSNARTSSEIMEAGPSIQGTTGQKVRNRTGNEADTVHAVGNETRRRFARQRAVERGPQRLDEHDREEDLDVDTKAIDKRIGDFAGYAATRPIEAGMSVEAGILAADQAIADARYMREISEEDEQDTLDAVRAGIRQRYQKAINPRVVRRSIDRTRNIANRENIGHDAEAQQDIVRGRVHQDENLAPGDFEDTADEASRQINPSNQYRDQMNQKLNRTKAINKRVADLASGTYDEVNLFGSKIDDENHQFVSEVAELDLMDRFENGEIDEQDYQDTLQALRSGLNTRRQQMTQKNIAHKMAINKRVADIADGIYNQAYDQRRQDFPNEPERTAHIVAQSAAARHLIRSSDTGMTQPHESIPEEDRLNQQDYQDTARAFLVGKRDQIASRQKNFSIRRRIGLAGKFLGSLAYEKAFSDLQKEECRKHCIELGQILEGLEVSDDEMDLDEHLEDGEYDDDQVLHGDDLPDMPLESDEENMPANVLRKDGDMEVGDIGYKMPVNKRVADLAGHNAENIRVGGGGHTAAQAAEGAQMVIDAHLEPLGELSVDDYQDTSRAVAQGLRWREQDRLRTPQKSISDQQKELAQVFINQSKQLAELTRTLETLGS